MAISLEVPIPRNRDVSQAYIDRLEKKIENAGLDKLWNQAANDARAAAVFADWWEEQGEHQAAKSWRRYASILRRRGSVRRKYNGRRRLY